ncbi:MAG: ABC transporter ATP-binding protein [Alphaproteobacteria bacterium]|nr:ABC transporter ATP-binding protein [Alphaproteobacteria bacterium]
MGDKPLIEINDLWVTYWARSAFQLRSKPFHAVKGVSLSIKAGQTLGIVGESGSGKSSLANAVLGLVPVESGTIRFDQHELSAMKTRYPAAVRKQIQAVFQDPFSSLNPSMTVEDIISEPLRVHTKMSNDQRRDLVVELLELVSLSKDHLKRHPHEFSGGQRQRIAIASALALQPKLLVLDEPVSALDVSTQNQIINLLYERRDALGIAYMLIAHDLALVHHISDRIAVMYLGHIVEEGPADRVYKNPAHPYTKALLEAVPLLDPAKQRARRAARKAQPAYDTPRDAQVGCPYKNRCAQVLPKCQTQAPTPFSVKGGGVASCFLVADAQPTSEAL